MSTTVAIDVAHIQPKNAILNRKYQAANIIFYIIYRQYYFLKKSSDVNQFVKTQRPSAAFI